MADLTQQHIVDIQALTANVETASRALQRSRTALSYLITAGRATCVDVRSFNLMVKSTYFYQKSISDIIRASGGTAPDIPAPFYVSYKGKTGEAAINIDCSTMQGPQGPMPTPFVDPNAVEWRQGATPEDIVAITKTLQGVRPPTGELGNPLLVAIVPIILWGIVLSVTGYIVLKIVEALTDVPAKREYTKQVATSAERHAAVMEARQKCLVDCARSGKDTETCAKSCSRLYPEFKPPAAPGGLGLMGKLLLGASGIGVIVLGYYAVKRYVLEGGSTDGAYGQLPPGYEYGGDADVIDVDFEERA